VKEREYGGRGKWLCRMNEWEDREDEEKNERKIKK